MLKAVFIGMRWEFTEVLVDWLSRRTELTGVVWIDSMNWQRTWKGRLRFTYRRFRRLGLLKVIDEAIYYTWQRTFTLRRAYEEILEGILRPYWSMHGIPRWEGRNHNDHDVNSLETLAFLKDSGPDVILTMCIANYFGKSVRELARLGVFVFHEGITPQYKGLYSPFWTIHNLDFARIGYTLLRMNESIDSGEVFVQGQALGVNPYRHTHPFIGHKSIVDGLPAVAKFLTALESGTANPIDRSQSESQYYTYPGISDLIRQRIRLRRALRNRQPMIPPK